VLARQALYCLSQASNSINSLWGFFCQCYLLVCMYIHKPDDDIWSRTVHVYDGRPKLLQCSWRVCIT
jgi:hypothetical protein